MDLVRYQTIPSSNAKKLPILGKGTFGKVYQEDETALKVFTGSLEESFKSCLIEGLNCCFLSKAILFLSPLVISYPTRRIRFPLAIGDLTARVSQAQLIQEINQKKSISRVPSPRTPLEDEIVPSGEEISRSVSEPTLDSPREKDIGIPIEPMFLFSIAASILDIHHRNLCHLDITRKNFVEMPTGEVRLIDAGSAIVNFSCRSAEFTQYKTSMPYRAPELLLRRSFNQKADIWSLGVLFHELMYGKYLFGYEQSIIKMLKNIHLVTGDLDKLQKKIYDRELSKVYMPRPIYRSPPVNCFDNLIYWMTRCNVQERYDIIDVLRHPFFSDIYDVNYLNSFGREDKHVLEKLRIDNMREHQYYPLNCYNEVFQGALIDDGGFMTTTDYITLGMRRRLIERLIKVYLNQELHFETIPRVVYLFDSLISNSDFQVKQENAFFVLSCCYYLIAITYFDELLSIKTLRAIFGIHIREYNDTDFSLKLGAIARELDCQFYLPLPSDFLVVYDTNFMKLQLICCYLGLSMYFSSEEISVALHRLLCISCMRCDVLEEQYDTAVGGIINPVIDEARITAILKTLLMYIRNSPKKIQETFGISIELQEMLSQ